MRRHVFKAIRFVLSLGLIVYLLTLIDIDELRQRITNLYWAPLALGAALLACQSVFSAAKWRIILAADDHSVPVLRLLRIILIGNFFSLFLPTSFGGDAYRVYRIGRSQAGFHRSTASVLFDRGSGLFALVSIGLIAYALVGPALVVYSLLGGYVVGIAGFFVLTSRWSTDRLGRWPRGKHAASVVESLRRYRTHFPTLASTLVVSFAFQMNTVAINHAYLVALGSEIPWNHLLVIVPVVYLTEVLPISINGVGVREGTYAMLFSLYGYAVADAVALGLIVLTMRYVVGLIGGSLYLWESLQPRVGNDEHESATT